MSGDGRSTDAAGGAAADEGLLDLHAVRVPAPDIGAEPDGFVVTVDAADRIHFLDWGQPDSAAAEGGEDDGPATPAVLLIHGLNQTAWAWAPVARRLCRVRRVVALDLRGHGLSDAPTHGYEPEALAGDAIAVAEAVADAVIIAGHGFGAIVAAWTAARLGERCERLVLVDGGWEDVGRDSGMAPDEFLPTIEEPPEILRSMTTFLADRRGFDPTTWDGDQERAARSTVVEVPAGHLVPAVRPHALAGMVESLLVYRPLQTLAAVTAPIVALQAGPDEDGARAAALGDADGGVRGAGRRPIRVARFPADGHNLMRYRPAEVAAAILAVDR